MRTRLIREDGAVGVPSLEIVFGFVAADWLAGWFGHGLVILRCFVCRGGNEFIYFLSSKLFYADWLEIYQCTVLSNMVCSITRQLKKQSHKLNTTWNNNKIKKQLSKHFAFLFYRSPKCNNNIKKQLIKIVFRLVSFLPITKKYCNISYQKKIPLNRQHHPPTLHSQNNPLNHLNIRPQSSFKLPTTPTQIFDLIWKIPCERK